MRILTITLDKDLLTTVKEVAEQFKLSINHISESISDIKIILEINKFKPHALILDDSYFAPATVAMIDTIRQFSDNVYIIFATENESVKLGRELSKYRIHSYHMKPINRERLNQSLKSIKTCLEKKSTL